MIALSLLVATPALAQGKPDPAAVTAGSYNIDPRHSQVLFTVNHMGFSEYTGQFTNPTGTLTIDPKNPSAAKVDVTFPIDKVSTTVPDLDAHLKTKDFFDVASFPTAHFVSTKVEVSGNSAKITGDLTMHGVTKPVVLEARFVGAGPAPMGPKKTNVGFAATGTIKRSEFGISTYVPMVSDDVKIVINAAFAAQ
jgi:polyisoprenoid-binding protein YceI